MSRFGKILARQCIIIAVGTASFAIGWLADEYVHPLNGGGGTRVGSQSNGKQ